MSCLLSFAIAIGAPPAAPGYTDLDAALKAARKTKSRVVVYVFDSL